jgi:CheY-like chemotaxis protein
MDQAKTILLIDDDADDRAMFMALIADIDESIDCMVAKDAETASALLATTNSFSPDLIFVDMNMPRVSGDQFIKQFRRSEEGSEVPIIIYSSAPVPVEIQKELFSVGVTNFLVKVSSQKEMRSLISNMLVQFDIYKPTKMAS